jgi:dephospho-CoA kinase
MLRVGLTGGIGCGKSTVAAMLRELGCHVLDADSLAKQLYEPGAAAYDRIIREFGREIVAADGRVDRARLAQIVFKEPARLSALNGILHPLVIARQEEWLASLAKTDPHGIAVVEAALLIEAGGHTNLDRVVVVWCRPEQQIERLVNESRGMSRADAEARIAAQMPLDEKRRYATGEIDNSGSIEETRERVRALVAQWKALAAR